MRARSVYPVPRTRTSSDSPAAPPPAGPLTWVEPVAPLRSPLIGRWPLRGAVGSGRTPHGACRPGKKPVAGSGDGGDWASAGGAAGAVWIGDSLVKEAAGTAGRTLEVVTGERWIVWTARRCELCLPEEVCWRDGSREVNIGIR